MKLLISLLCALIFSGCMSAQERRYIEGQENVYKLLQPGGGSGGTGFVLKIDDNTKVIVTNRHVCSLAQNGVLISERQGVQQTVRVIREFYTHDLCLVSTPNNAGGGYKLAKQGPKRGEFTYAAGHPSLGPFQITTGQHLGRAIIQVAYESGVIEDTEPKCSRPEFELRKQFFFYVCVATLDAGQFNAHIEPGSSGSPVLNKDDEVVGVVFAGDSRTNVGFYVPYEYLKAAIAYP